MVRAYGFKTEQDLEGRNILLQWTLVRCKPQQNEKRCKTHRVETYCKNGLQSVNNWKLKKL